jgi:2-methylfumaryl-CoA isomerase
MPDSPPAILAGLRVVEISAFIAAPLGGACLASLGADVIRIDPPGGGIDIDRWPVHRGRSLYWAGLNQGKRSVTIDLRTERGREQATKVITAPGENGGIFLTNIAGSGWSSYETLSTHRRDLIMVVISGSRDGGTAVDYTVNAGIGFPLITGAAGVDGPVNHVLPAWDAITGYLAAAAILAAERHRRATGEGQLVRLSLADVATAVAGHLGLLAEAQLSAEPRGRYGNYVFGSFGRDFETRDGRRVMVLALTPRQWKSLGEATGLTADFADLAAREHADFAAEGDRWRCREAISTLIEPWIRARDQATVAEAFDGAGVLWGPYRTFQEFVAGDEIARSPSSFISSVQHPGIGEYTTVGSPLTFGRSANVPPQPSPVLGQHTEEVLRELGIEPDR